MSSNAGPCGPGSDSRALWKQRVGASPKYRYLFYQAACQVLERSVTSAAALLVSSCDIRLGNPPPGPAPESARYRKGSSDDRRRRRGQRRPARANGQLPVQHLHAGIVVLDGFRLKQNLLRRQIQQRVQQTGGLRQPAAHALARDIDAVPSASPPAGAG